jgi:hypothetical protein
MDGPEFAKRGRRAGRATEGGDRRRESVVAEALPSILASPDVDDAEAVVGRTGDMQD